MNFNQESAQQAVDVLNQALAADPKAIQLLFDYRVSVGDTVADHESIMVRTKQGKHTLGVLGLLNGILGLNEKGTGPVMAEIDDNGMIERFRL
jgi:hypothetical protein